MRVRVLTLHAIPLTTKFKPTLSPFLGSNEVQRVATTLRTASPLQRSDVGLELMDPLRGITSFSADLPILARIGRTETNQRLWMEREVVCS